MASIKTSLILCASLALMGTGLILLSISSSVVDRLGALAIKPASASGQLGILGQQAPELELNSWVDGNGKPMDPIKLRDYRGKVIYLYFFQDW